MLCTHAHELYSRENQMRRQRVSTKVRAHTFQTLTTTLSRRVIIGVFCGEVRKRGRGLRTTKKVFYSHQIVRGGVRLGSTLILKGNQFLMLRRTTITTLQAKAIVRTLIMMATILLEKYLQEMIGKVTAEEDLPPAILMF